MEDEMISHAIIINIKQYVYIKVVVRSSPDAGMQLCQTF